MEDGGFKKSWNGKTLSSSPGLIQHPACNSPQYFIFSTMVNVLRVPVDTHLGQKKTVFVWLSSNKVKGSMYFTALWAARLIRAGAGHGACVGYSEVKV